MAALRRLHTNVVLLVAAAVGAKPVAGRQPAGYAAEDKKYQRGVLHKKKRTNIRV